MESYCVNCRKNTANKNLGGRKTKKKNRLIFLSNCTINARKSQSSLKVRTPLSIIQHL